MARGSWVAINGAASAAMTMMTNIESPITKRGWLTTKCLTRFQRFDPV